MRVHVSSIHAPLFEQSELLVQTYSNVCWIQHARPLARAGAGGEEEEEEEAERAGRDTEPKTRTPHKDVGKNKQALVADAFVFPKNQPEHACGTLKLADATAIQIQVV